MSADVVVVELDSPPVSRRSTRLPRSPCTTRVSVTTSPIPSCSSSRVTTPDGRPSKRRKQTDEIDDVMGLGLTKLSAVPAYEHEPDVDFGRVVVSELKQMTDDQKKIAKKIIYDTLYLGSTSSLTPDHRIVKPLDSTSFLA